MNDWIKITKKVKNHWHKFNNLQKQTVRKLQIH